MGQEAIGCTQAPSDYRGETAIEGTVRRDGAAFEGAYVRLKGGEDEFVAEIRTGPTGTFHFHPVEGTWTVICLAPGDVRGETQVKLAKGETAQLNFDVAAPAAGV